MSLKSLLLSALAVIAAPSAATETEAGPENWSIHGQTTFVWQADPGFHASFSGPNSLSGKAQDKETFDSTLFLGVRLHENLAFYADPEIDQGLGLQNTLGIAGFTSGEAYKVGLYNPYIRLPRAFFRYVAGTGGETQGDAPAANQLGGSHEEDNVTLTLGKFSLPDIFDTNRYAHDPRADFFNWSIIESGAFDYAADAWGFTYGAAAEWNQSWWTLRAGVFDLSRVPNTKFLVRGLGQFSMVGEAEARHDLWSQPGAIKLLFFVNRAHMGSYDDAVSLALESGSTPSTALVRRFASRVGGAINLQQQVRPDLGVFLRASLNEGGKEAFDFSDINQSLSSGFALQGTRWGRQDDTAGAAFAVNGISKAAKRYFADGGTGLLVGDGALPRSAPERILETYYSFAATAWSKLSIDYQFIDNPAYNPMRGPVSVFALRAHAEF